MHIGEKFSLVWTDVRDPWNKNKISRQYMMLNNGKAARSLCAVNKYIYKDKSCSEGRWMKMI